MVREIVDWTTHNRNEFLVRSLFDEEMASHVLKILNREQSLM